MFCTKCGNALPVNAKFCTKCGTKVEAFQPGAIQPNPTPQRASVPQPQQKKNEKVTKTKNSEKISNKNKNETEKKSGSGAGAGKSTSIDVFGIHVLQEYGGKLAVLAIAPSSERSKGSILGDKTRMEKLAVHPDSFIRPSPSAGSLGGVARKTRETIILCEAAGFDKIFVETVGVGQSETACHSMVDFFLLIQLAGTGDELQGIKRGIMEMADGIVINKCDGNNVDKCQLAATQFRNALHLFPAPESGWTPQVLTYSGFYNLGVKEIWDMVYRYMDFVKGNGYFEHRRNEQSKYWMYETINEQLRNSFFQNEQIVSRLAEAEAMVLSGRQTSFVAAKQLLDEYFASLR